MAGSGCLTCDGLAACAHCWHGLVRPDGAVLACCRCDADHPAPEPVPAYRDTWATPPSDVFRRLDEEH